MKIYAARDRNSIDSFIGDDIWVHAITTDYFGRRYDEYTKVVRKMNAHNKTYYVVQILRMNTNNQAKDPFITLQATLPEEDIEIVKPIEVFSYEEVQEKLRQDYGDTL